MFKAGSVKQCNIKRTDWFLKTLKKLLVQLTESPCGLKLTKKIRYNTAKCMKEAYDSIKLCVKCEDKETQFVKQRRCVRQGYNLGPCLFSTLQVILQIILVDNLHTSTTGAQIVSRLLFADDFPTSSSTINGLQKATEQDAMYSRDLNLKCNLNKFKILIFTKGARLKKNDSWTIYDQTI